VPPRPADEPSASARWRGVLRGYRPTGCYLHAGPGKHDFLQDARELGAKTLLDVSPDAAGRSSAEVIDCVRRADVFVLSFGFGAE